MKKLVLKRLFYVYSGEHSMLHLQSCKTLTEARAWAFKYRSQHNLPITIRDTFGREYALGRYQTGKLFQQSERTESDGDSMGWKEVKKAAVGPFVAFGEGKDTKRLFLVGEPEVIKARKYGASAEAPTEDVGVLPVLLDGKFKVLTLRSSRLRTALEEKWLVIAGKMVDITRTKHAKNTFDTKYSVKLSASKKKPDARLISGAETAFAEFLKHNAQMAQDVPE